MDIEAGLTNLARQLRARSLTEGIVLGDWSIQFGDDGFDPMDPDEVTAIDFDAQTLGSPLGAARPLGLVIDSGAAASVTPLGGGHVQVDGLLAIPNFTFRRWLTLSGSADPFINGTWRIGSWLSSTSVIVHAPLVEVADAGPLSWELRRACILRPNAGALAFYGRLPSVDPINDAEIGEVGIFGRVLASPLDPSILGLGYLHAVAHLPSAAKIEGVVMSPRICVQA